MEKQGNPVLFFCSHHVTIKQKQVKKELNQVTKTMMTSIKLICLFFSKLPVYLFRDKARSNFK